DLSISPLQPSGKSPCLDHYGRGVFGGNRTRVGLVPMVGGGPAAIAATAVLSCHIKAGSTPAFFFAFGVWEYEERKRKAISTGQRNTSDNFSAGVRNFKVSRGRPLSCRATASSCCWECTDRSVPFGKYWRSRPLV